MIISGKCYSVCVFHFKLDVVAQLQDGLYRKQQDMFTEELKDAVSGIIQNYIQLYEY